MSSYQTEEEQVEAIKKWWKDNGNSVIAGVVIGLGAVFGWKGWVSYQDRIGQEASLAFSQLLHSVQGGNSESASQQAELLRADYESSSYAVIAALIQARLKLEQGDSVAARSQLEWAVAKSSSPSLKQLASLNLARILLNEGEYSAAAELAQQEEGGFAGEFAELRGDIAVAQSNHDSARQAYTQALALNANASGRLQMKLDDLPPEAP
jgi:predicted negative regulator of RcsB-dependent stress response